jgi:hypothetical protein
LDERPRCCPIVQARALDQRNGTRKCRAFAGANPTGKLGDVEPFAIHESLRPGAPDYGGRRERSSEAISTGRAKEFRNKNNGITDPTSIFIECPAKVRTLQLRKATNDVS